MCSWLHIQLSADPVACLQGLDIEHSMDAKAAQPARRHRAQPQEAPLPPRSPTAARTLLLCDFDQTLTNWDAGALTAAEPALACMHVSRVVGSSRSVLCVSKSPCSHALWPVSSARELLQLMPAEHEVRHQVHA